MAVNVALGFLKGLRVILGLEVMAFGNMTLGVDHKRPVLQHDMPQPNAS